ncbi:GNAT family N-acetyltransferase [Klebsiella pneumoniae]|uniref:GNAT family N-acetyltransferase n=2 Tax=Klebsiella pneumoniae TaxID=573 RepID=UPI002D76C0C1|nr:GNAT family N-acetyltransferase [Klebsiella pneumoniae]
MKIRLAVPVEAEECWNIRNQAIRYGCKSSYDDAVIAAWTPEKMPESYRNVIVVNPFFVVAAPDGRLLATGYLDLSTGSIEAVFTLPQYTGKGLGSQIIEAIKSEARGRGFEQLTLSSTPKEGANKQVISSQADSLIKISRIWADFFPANTSNQPI